MMMMMVFVLFLHRSVLLILVDVGHGWWEAWFGFLEANICLMSYV